jgi:hypothetical protein
MKLLPLAATATIVFSMYAPVTQAAASFQLQRITPREMPLVPGASTRYRLEPGQTHRCLIHLQSFTRYTEPLQFPIEVNWPQQGIGGGTLMDTNADNNSAILTLGPTDSGGGSPVAASSLRPIALCVLAMALALAAGRSRRSRR